MNLFIQNFTVLYYEKAVLTNHFNQFQSDFPHLINERIENLVFLLNNKIDFSIPLYRLKYVNAFENNQPYFIATAHKLSS